MKNIEKLFGKTIKKAWIEGIKNDEPLEEPYDDKPYLFLEMEDGSVFKIISGYRSYTGNSKDEYPCFIFVEEVKK